MAQVKIENICKSFSGTQVLKNLNLEIGDGELFFLLGSSGCGKSTLLRILAGLTAPDSGAIYFDGENIVDTVPEKRRAAMVFQNYALWPHMTVFENVAFGLKCGNYPKDKIKSRVMEVLELVQLANYDQRNIQQLSGGQQQRVALARALAVHPRLLLLDEPLSNLDARLRENMRQLIRDICKKEKLTALYVTHDRQEAFSMGDKLGIMHNGVVRQSGEPAQLYDHPCDRFCAEFLGDANFFSGKVSDGYIELPFGRFALTGSCDGAVSAMIRPERLHFCQPGEGFEVEMIGKCYLGDSTIWNCRTVNGGVSLCVRESAAPRREIGETANIAFEKDCLLALPENNI